MLVQATVQPRFGNLKALVLVWNFTDRPSTNQRSSGTIGIPAKSTELYTGYIWLTSCDSRLPSLKLRCHPLDEEAEDSQGVRIRHAIHKQIRLIALVTNSCR